MWEKLKRVWLERPLNIILIFASCLIVAVLLNYFSNFPLIRSTDQAIWGQFGDYFGGVLNPVLSFFALVGLLVTLKAQQLEGVRAESRHQQQLFDTRLFQMLSLSHQAVAAIKYTRYNHVQKTRDEYEGHRGVAYALIQLQEGYLYEAELEPNDLYDRLSDEFGKWKAEYWSGVASYVESMLFILKYVFEETAASKDNKFALRAVFAQMSSDEKLLLFYVMLFTSRQSILISNEIIEEFLEGASSDDLSHYRRDLLHAAIAHRISPKRRTARPT